MSLPAKVSESSLEKYFSTTRRSFLGKRVSERQTRWSGLLKSNWESRPCCMAWSIHSDRFAHPKWCLKRFPWSNAGKKGSWRWREKRMKTRPAWTREWTRTEKRRLCQGIENWRIEKRLLDQRWRPLSVDKFRKCKTKSTGGYLWETEEDVGSSRSVELSSVIPWVWQEPFCHPRFQTTKMSTLTLISISSDGSRCLNRLLFQNNHQVVMFTLNCRQQKMS